MSNTTTAQSTARVEALAVSDLTGTGPVTLEMVERAVARATGRCGGPAGVTAALAYEYGEHPQETARRVRWARGVLEALAQPEPTTAVVGPVSVRCGGVG